ncbi:MAG: cyclic nucleotide-binding domain-containing protein [Nitrospirales bacterium]
MEEPFGLIKPRALYQGGQYVFYKGHVALGLYILCQGRVKLTQLNRKGQQRLGGILDAGQLLEKQAFQEQPDGRFHLSTGQTDTTNNFGTAF